jgi:hypothetical protein
VEFAGEECRIKTGTYEYGKIKREKYYNSRKYVKKKDIGGGENRWLLLLTRPFASHGLRWMTVVGRHARLELLPRTFFKVRVRSLHTM